MDETGGHSAKWNKPDRERHNTVRYHLYAESKKNKTVELIESKLVVAGGWGSGQWGDVGQRIQTASDKMNNFWGSNVLYGDYR